MQGTYDSDIISVKSLNDHEAGIYLEKELDREVNARSSETQKALFNFPN